MDRLKRSQLELMLALAVLAASSMWFYMRQVLVPHEVTEAVALGLPRGNLSDLYPRWLGSRELLLHHRDPYSLALTREIQAGYYGRVLDASRPDDPKDQQAFAYPVYVSFLLAPTFGMQFETVRLIFAGLLALLVCASVPLWLWALGWRPPLVVAATLIIFALGSFPAAQGIGLQQLSLLVAGLIAGAAALLASGYLFSAGLLLAVATIKPQLVLPLIVWLALWAASDWQRRRRLFWGFGSTLAVLLAGAEVALPAWIPRFLAALSAYRQYTGGHSLLSVLVRPPWANIATVMILLGTSVVGWRMRRAPANSFGFGATLALLLAATLLVVPMFAPYNQILLLPAVLLIVRSWRRLWNASLIVKVVCVVAAGVVAWPWIATLGLILASAVTPPAVLQQHAALPLRTTFHIPLAILAVLALLVSDALRDETLRDENRRDKNPRDETQRDEIQRRAASSAQSA
jgi:hypothetical protein